MQRTGKTYLNRAFDHIDNVIYIMEEVLKGKSADDIKDHLVEMDPFRLGSDEYKKIIARWLISYYVKSFSKEPLEVFARIMTSDNIELQVKREILFWKTCEQDRLAADITLGPVYRAYHQKDPFIFLEDLKRFVKNNTGFADNTVHECAKRYLMITTKVGFISSNNSNLDINFFRPKKKSIAAILFFLFNKQMPPSKILRADDFKYLLLDEQDVITCFADLSNSGFIQFAVAGNIVRLEPKLDFEVLPSAIEN